MGFALSDTSPKAFTSEKYFIIQGGWVRGRGKETYDRCEDGVDRRFFAWWDVILHKSERCY